MVPMTPNSHSWVYDRMRSFTRLTRMPSCRRSDWRRHHLLVESRGGWLQEVIHNGREEDLERAAGRRRRRSRRGWESW
ncbi:unnamed protein product [Triticum turgidum subsp. durum]|uniref:Uncharacterized protein n=1 Tax=Triticum turgidum subsp. durum TaxID=4567 RepID=A0A9R0W6W1_TRITD|nr:unnamed protein product [Triticum turgidum subsp. durum]